MLAQKTDEARALGNEVRSLDSSNILGALLVASVDIIEDRSAAAADVLKSAARLDPENWVPEYLLGLVLIGQRQAREAIHHLRSANRNQPRSAAVHHALGVAFGLGGEWGKAIRAFREALVLAPGRRESVLALAHVLLRQDETEDAIGVLAERVSAWPQDREVQELLAHSYRETNDYRAAKRHLQVALQSIPEDEDYAISRARVLNNIGFCSGHLRQQEEAAEWYSRSIKAWPTMEAFRNLARVYRELGRLESALGVIANALAQNPDDAVAKLLGGVTAAQLGYLDEAISTLKGLTSGRGEVAQDAYASLGRILADEKRDYSAALEVSLRGHQRFPEDAVIVNNVAYVNLMLGNVDAARAVLHGVPEAGISQSIYLTATMGLLRLWQGDLEGAVNFYRAAERLAQRMHLEFARAYLRVDDRRSAEEHIKRGFPIKGRQSYHDDLRELRLYLREA